MVLGYGSWYESVDGSGYGSGDGSGYGSGDGSGYVSEMDLGMILGNGFR